MDAIFQGKPQSGPVGIDRSKGRVIQRVVVQKGISQPLRRYLEVTLWHGCQVVIAQIEMRQPLQLFNACWPLCEPGVFQVQARQLAHLREARYDPERVVAQVEHPEVFQGCQFACGFSSEGDAVIRQVKLFQGLQVEQ